MIRDAYVAIADPTRRRILDLLRERETLPAGEIAAHFPTVSRPAISRHLRVLRECGVVISAVRGKAHHYALDTTPLSAIHQGWLAGFSKRSTQSLVRLREMVERGESV